MQQRGVAVVTGASAGVGRSVATLLAEQGYDVGLLARGKGGLDAAAKEIDQLGRRAIVLPIDVSDFTQVDDAATQVEERLGPIDIWINDAMTTVFSPLAEVAPSDFQRAVEVTFLGQVWGTMAALLAHASTGPRQHRQCRLRPVLRGDPAADRVLLVEVRMPGVLRVRSVRAAPCGEPCPHEHGAPARREHAQFDWCETTLDRHPQPVPPIYQPEVPARAIVEVALDGRRSKIVGSWNKLLVLVDSVFPGLGNQYAALASWSGQMTEEKVSPDRPSNLRAPVDAEADHGSHGAFDDRSGGVLDPHFLRSLPETARTFGQAIGRTYREALRTRRMRSCSHASPPGNGG